MLCENVVRNQLSLEIIMEMQICQSAFLSYWCFYTSCDISISSTPPTENGLHFKMRHMIMKIAFGIANVWSAFSA